VQYTEIIRLISGMRDRARTLLVILYLFLRNEPNEFKFEVSVKFFKYKQNYSLFSKEGLKSYFMEFNCNPLKFSIKVSN